MVTSQPHRSGTVQAWWAHTGSTNRGFVSLDPERQREVDSGRPARRKSIANEFAFDVRRAGAPGRPARPGQGPPHKPGKSNHSRRPGAPPDKAGGRPR